MINVEFRYLLFTFDNYDRAGGFNDFVFGFSTFEEFKEKLETIEYEDIDFKIFEILDLSKLENFEVLSIDEDKEPNVKSKLKKAVRGYFAYDKTR